MPKLRVPKVRAAQLRAGLLQIATYCAFAVVGIWIAMGALHILAPRAPVAPVPSYIHVHVPEPSHFAPPAPSPPPTRPARPAPRPAIQAP